MGRHDDTRYVPQYLYTLATCVPSLTLAPVLWAPDADLKDLYRMMDIRPDTIRVLIYNKEMLGCFFYPIVINVYIPTQHKVTILKSLQQSWSVSTSQCSGVLCPASSAYLTFADYAVIPLPTTQLVLSYTL